MQTETQSFYDTRLCRIITIGLFAIGFALMLSAFIP
jgi:hypothetical protein